MARGRSRRWKVLLFLAAIGRKYTPSRWNRECRSVNRAGAGSHPSRGTENHIAVADVAGRVGGADHQDVRP